MSRHHPSYEGQRCTAFVIYSSLELKWITVPCNSSFRDTLTICQTFRWTAYQNSTLIRREYFECPNGWVKINSYCHQMISSPTTRHLTCDEARAACKGMFSYSDSEIAERTLLYYFEWLNDPLEESFYGGGALHCLEVQLVQSITLMSLVMQVDSMRTPPHAAVCKTELVPVEYLCPISQFTCGDGSCILQHYLCDGKTDCPDDSDEIACKHVCQFSEDVKLIDHPSKCYTDCHRSNCSCHALYYQCHIAGGCIPASRLCDGKVDCAAEEDELDCFDSGFGASTVYVNATGFTCDDGTLIPISQVNDLIPDCPGGRGEDEARMKWYWSGNKEKLSNRYRCPTTYTECVKGLHGICYPRHKLCVYEVDLVKTQIRYCRNGAHLNNCSSHECPNMFKCRLSYCIPFHYVCNGRLDCPHGEDENCRPSLECPGLLRCRDDNVCVHPNNVGDNMIDCQLSNDDETLLDVVKCPDSCECLGNSVSCSFAGVDILNSLWVSVRTVSFRSSVIDIRSCFHLVELLFLDLSNNSISSSSFPHFCSLPHIKWLDLHDNLIGGLGLSMFKGLGSLRYLELQMNPIRTIDPFSFSDLDRLLVLNMSHLQLTQISSNTFCGLASLISLDLSYNQLKRLDIDSFNAFKDTLTGLLLITNSTPAGFLDVIPLLPTVADLHVYSAIDCPYIAKEVICHFMEDYKGHCCSLISSLAIEILLWIYGIVLTIMCFVATIFWTFSEANMISKFFMIIINACVLGVATYPLYIVAVHNYYRSFFLFYRASFIETFHCIAVSLIFLWSHYSCMFAVLLATCHHCIVIIYPLKDFTLISKWFVGALSFLPISFMTIALVGVGFGFMSRSFICQILPVTKGNGLSSYVTFVLIAMEFVLHAVTSTMHFVAFYTLRNRKGNVNSHGSNRLKQRASLRRGLFGSFEVICLIISSIMHLMVLFREFESDYMLLFTLILLLYELFIPLLYTFSTTNFSNVISSAISSCF